jgi:hypothetical protein
VERQEEGLFDKVEFVTKELEELKKKMENTLDKGQGYSTFADFAHFAYANEGNCAQLLIYPYYHKCHFQIGFLIRVHRNM